MKRAWLVLSPLRNSSGGSRGWWDGSLSRILRWFEPCGHQYSLKKRSGMNARTESKTGESLWIFFSRLTRTILKRRKRKEKRENDRIPVSPVWLNVIFYSYFLQTNKRFEADELKRAEDASRDAKFSAIMAIFFGVAIVLFCIFIFAIVPVLA